MLPRYLDGLILHHRDDRETPNDRPLVSIGFHQLLHSQEVSSLLLLAARVMALAHPHFVLESQVMSAPKSQAEVALQAGRYFLAAVP